MFLHSLCTCTSVIRCRLPFFLLDKILTYAEYFIPPFQLYAQISYVLHETSIVAFFYFITSSIILFALLISLYFGIMQDGTHSISSCSEFHNATQAAKKLVPSIDGTNLFSFFVIVQHSFCFMEFVAQPKCFSVVALSLPLAVVYSV